jgi:CHRD domain-containing protein
MIRTGFIAAAFALAACGGGTSGPATHFTASLNAANEPGGVTSSATGTATYTVIGSDAYTNTGAVINYAITFSGLTAAASQGHIHVGATGVSGGVTVPFTNVPALTSGTFGGSITASNVQAATGGGVSVAGGSLDDLLAAMRAGNTYTNIYTSTNPNGEIRGQNQPH